MRLRFWGIALALAVCAAAAAVAVDFPPRPGETEFILDEANLIDPADRERIRSIAAATLKDTGIPIIVVTIPSLARYGASDIESYATQLFNHWGIGTRQTNYGILMLVSLGDRKARIELGASWEQAAVPSAVMIMNDIMIPNFKKGAYSAGILQGVQALDTMARGKSVRKPVVWWKVFLFIGGIVLGIAVAINLIRTGRKGWGWALLAAIFAILVAVLVAMARSGGRSGGGGGGRSFGGGFSGGRGATGSW